MIVSNERLRRGQWTTVMAERNQRDGSLSLNGGVAVKGTSPWQRGRLGNEGRGAGSREVGDSPTS